MKSLRKFVFFVFVLIADEEVVAARSTNPFIIGEDNQTNSKKPRFEAPPFSLD